MSEAHSLQNVSKRNRFVMLNILYDAAYDNAPL